MQPRADVEGAFRDALVAGGFETSTAAALGALVRPGAALVLDQDADSPVGGSRLGGMPDMAPGAPWPSTPEGRPLEFVAQVDLSCLDGRPSEVGNDAEVDQVPTARGLLTLFYDALDQPWGYDPGDEGHWSVVHTRPGLPLLPTPGPSEESTPFYPVVLRPTWEWQAAPWGSFEVASVVEGGPDAERWEAYDEAVAAVIGSLDEPCSSRLLGHPAPIQGDMQTECQLVVNGVYCGDGDHVRRIAEFPGAERWRLLLQIDSHEEAEMQWGDDGRLYVWMTKDDLAAGHFDRAWMVLQCS